MSTQTSPAASLGPTGIAFGLGMAVVGLVLGYMIGTTRGGGPSSADLNAKIERAVEERLAGADAGKGPQGKVINNTGGEIRRLSDKEKQELLSKKGEPGKAEPEPAVPVDSPFLTSAIEGTFKDEGARAEYRTAVALMHEGNARKARPLLNKLYLEAGDAPWREQVGVLLADAKVSVGEVDDGRRVLTEWTAAWPKSAHMALAVVAEGKAAMKDAKRLGSGKDGITPAQERGYRDAIALFDQAATRWPRDPALEQAWLNKAALLAEMGELDQAEAAAVSLAETFPTSNVAPRGLFNVAKQAFDTEDFERAERLYSRLVEEFPRDRLTRTARTNLSTLQLLGKPAPELEVSEWVGPDLGTMASLKGKPVLLVFWATWCPHCRTAMPTVENEIWRKYKDKGLQVIAVTKHSKGQTTDAVQAYLTENQYTVPVAIDPGGTSRDYGVSGIPAAALVDKTGKVVWRNHPAQVTDELIQKYL